MKTTRIIVFAGAIASLAWVLVLGTRYCPGGTLGCLVEFPEKLLIAACILSIAILKANFSNRVDGFSIWLAIGIGTFTFLSKGFILFFSEDGDIAQWHALTFATGCLTLILAVNDLGKRKGHLT